LPALVLAVCGLAFGVRGRPASILEAPPVTAADVHREAPARPGRPPQFVVASFDGAGGARLWGYWRSVARRAQAHFTFFLSGVYLVDWAHHDLYAPPRGVRGESAIGFAPDERWVRGTVREVELALRDGHELGTHYNGHFCGAGGVDTWTAADWSHELDQFDALMRRVHLPFGAGVVAGGRTPCLEGDLDALYPVLARRGFRYDASATAPLGTWPVRRDGIWSIPLLELPYPGHTYRVVSMDYNFFANGASEAGMYDSLWTAFQRVYRGNRAPLSLGNHFETWNAWAYDHALTRFLLRACRLPEVRCTSFRELVDWLDQTWSSGTGFSRDRSEQRRSKSARRLSRRAHANVSGTSAD
jgi:hypothetical protein